MGFNILTKFIVFDLWVMGVESWHKTTIEIGHHNRILVIIHVSTNNELINF